MEDRIRELIRHLKDGDEEYFDEFFQLTKNLVYYTAFSILKDYSLSEDILQETYLIFLQNIKRVKEKENIVAYLSKIAKNLSLNMVKKRGREVELDYDIKSTDQYSTSLNEDLLKIMKNVLRDDEFRIVILHLVNQYTHKEISKLLNKPLGTITWAYNNAIEKLRRVMKNGDWK